MADEHEEGWSPEKDNLQEKYIKKAMKLMDDIEKKKNEIPHAPAGDALGFAQPFIDPRVYDITVKRIENGFLVVFFDPNRCRPVTVFAEEGNVPTVVALAIKLDRVVGV